MAPAVRQGFAQEDLASVRIPVSIVAGVHDQVLPFASNAQYYAKLISGSQLTALESGGHFVFQGCSKFHLQHMRYGA
jgi:pimeloyl-ACP methyl ester carboxylesterase